MRSDLEIPYRLSGVLQLVEVAQKVTARADITKETKDRLAKSLAALYDLVNQDHFHTEEQFHEIDAKFDIVLQLMEIHKAILTPEEVAGIEEAKTRYRGKLPF
ncbi:MAG: hypothetical protein WC661_10205 [Opitutaceae bacterium]|jgi:hypothetical protein